MDYEKKYKEAVNKIKNLLDDGEKNGFTIVTYKTDLESIFPELAESEDERIRKAILNEITHFEKECVIEERKEVYRTWIAWLEKQGEQKSADKVEPKFKVGDSIKTANEEPLTITDITDNGYWSEDLFICSFDDAAKWELVEQKPAWSIKEKLMLNDIIETTERSNIFKENYQRELIDWLKSLKERYTWKPSDEQMKVLDEVLNFAANHESSYWNDYILGTLNNLIRQLKKLKGE